jgi:hypothetical protein
MSVEDHTVTFNLQVDTSEAVANIAELNRLLTTYISLARRTGLPEDIIEAIALIERMRLFVQTLTTAIMTFYTATGPIGWAIGLGGVAVSGFMLADMAAIRRPRY